MKLYHYGLFSLFMANSLPALAQQDVRDIFQQNCASCHGDNLEGGMAKSLVDKQWQYGTSDKKIFETIKNGVTEAGMPAWGSLLSDQDIRALVVYIQEKEYQAQQNELKSQVSEAGLAEFSTKEYTFSLETLAEFDSTIWAVTALPSGDILATEKQGKLWLIQPEQNGKKQVITEIKGIPEVWHRSQGGLLDVAVHPNYPKQPWVYLSYSQPSSSIGSDKEGTMTAIVRGQIVDGQWQSQQMVYSAPAKFHTRSGHHFGSRIVLHNGYVYFSVGDRGKMELAQDLSKPNGKIHRLYYDGRIPQNNPFVKQKEALPSIWSYGHRNPQGLALHPLTSDIWETEHGPRGGDEVNLIESNKNYGWPVITYGINYNGQPITDKTEMPGMEQPKHYWVPSIATGGIEFYQGKTFAKWQNNLLVTGMAKQELRRLVIRDNQVVEDEVLIKDQGRVRDVGVSPDGDILVVLNGANQTYKIVKLKVKS